MNPYCSSPWKTLRITNSGQYNYCCLMHDISGNNFNDSALINGRKEILSGKILSECKKVCYDFEGIHHTHREFMNKNYPINYNITEHIIESDIEYLDLRIGNLCNYTCLMCNSGSSHLWAKLVNQDTTYMGWTKEKYQEILDLITKMKNLKLISLAG